MKTLGKICLGFFCGFLVLLIAGMVVIGTTSPFSEIWQEVGQAVEDHRFFISSHNENNYENGFPMEEKDMDYSEQQTFSLEGIQSIVIQANACQLTAVQEENLDQVQANFKSGVLFGNDYARMETETQGDTLYIKVAERRTFSWFFKESTVSYSKLDLHIPASYRGNIQFELNASDSRIQDLSSEQTLQVTVQAGKLQLQGIEANQMQFSNNGAKTTMSQIRVSQEASLSCREGAVYGDILEAGSFSIQNYAGKTELQGITGPVSSDCSAGALNLSFAQVVADIQVNANAGSTQLTFPREAPILVNAAGSALEIDDHIQWTSGQQYRMENAEYIVSISGNAAHVTLEEQAQNP